jgi:anti-sigma B factor antagonist
VAELAPGSAANIEISTRLDPEGARVVSVAGELDSSNVEQLDALMSTLAQNPPQRLIFELGGLRFMDSAGIAVLVRAAGKTGVVQIRNPSPIVRRVIEVTGLTGVLRIGP